MARHFQEIGVKPELEFFDASGIWLANEMIVEGLISGPATSQFVLGSRYCTPYSAEPIQFLLGSLPKGAVWGHWGSGAGSFRWWPNHC
jgi:uncharacterized protein (DUF849 family)